MSKKIGIFPGVFDPVHDGHIKFGLDAARQNNLGKVYFLPEKNPHNKPDISTLKTRVSDLSEATKEYGELGVLKLMSDRFTVTETLPELLEIFKDDRMVLLIGSDSARTICCWPGVERLLSHVDIVVSLRGDDETGLINRLMAELIENTGVDVEYSVVKSAHPHLSSTLIRQQAFAT